MSDQHKYRVTGPCRVLGHKPGQTFEAVLPPEQEAFLIEVGHITKVPAKTTGNGSNQKEKS